MWQPIFVNWSRKSDRILAFDRSNGHCLGVSFGDSATWREMRGGRVLEHIEGPESFVRWIAGNDYGPFYYESFGLESRYPPLTRVRVKLVRWNAPCGRVAICVGDVLVVSRITPHCPFTELAPPAQTNVA